MTDVYLFTYGTLRPSGPLDDLTPGRHIGTGTTPGRLYRHQAARFPVFADTFSSEDTSLVTGDVFAIDSAHAHDLDFVIDMEVGAGYDVRVRQVRLSELPPYGPFLPGDTVPAIVFTWPERYDVGPRIYCGDWLSAEAASVCTDLNYGAGFAPRSR